MITARFVPDEFEICLVCAGLVLDNLSDAVRCGSWSGLVLSKIVLHSHLAQSGQLHCGSFIVLLRRCWQCQRLYH